MDRSHLFKPLLLFLIGVALSSCLPAAPPANIIVTDRPMSIDEVDPSVTLTESSVRFQTNQIDLTITKPPEWETFSTEFGVVIAEKFGSVATGGILEGLMCYTFVTPLSDFELNVATDTNITQTIFNQIIADPNYVVNAAVSPPYAFNWNGHDAAYYLLNDGDGNVTMVIGVALPEQGILLTSSISAPTTASGRIRESLPELLKDLQINGVTFNGNIELPASLEFPSLGVEEK